MKVNLEERQILILFHFHKNTYEVKHLHLPYFWRIWFCFSEVIYSYEGNVGILCYWIRTQTGCRDKEKKNTSSYKCIPPKWNFSDIKCIADFVACIFPFILKTKCIINSYTRNFWAKDFSKDFLEIPEIPKVILKYHWIKFKCVLRFICKLSFIFKYF